MDLGIAGRSALVCASSRGLGYACAEALAREGVNVVLNGRDEQRVESAVQRLSSIADGTVAGVRADLNTPDGRRALVDACPAPDILITNNAGPSPGDFEKLSHSDWLAAINANMLAPLALIQATISGMCERRFGRIVNITSAMVTTPRARMALSSGARAGLSAVAKGLSQEVARHNVTINNLLPERIDTDRQQEMARLAVHREEISYEEARRRQVGSIAARRLGTPAEVGAACAFLCSTQASYISGQNLHLDGGSYPALL